MNMRLYMVVAGGFTALSLLACTSDTTGSGGSGGTGNTGNEGGAGVGATGSGATGSGAAGGTGGSAACQTCAEAIDPDTGDPDLLCKPESSDLYDALVACTCTGNCMADCADSACAMPPMPLSTDCQGCLTDMNPATGCGMEFGACSGDTP